MTAPSPETIEREKDKLWVTDPELVRRLGIPRDTIMPVIRRLDEDRRSGFPKKQKLFGDRRYWPAVKDYFDALYGAKIEPSKRRASNG